MRGINPRVMSGESHANGRGSPYVAQGAAQAVEDAAMLSHLLSSSSTTRNNIPGVLKLYETARKARAEAIQGTANGNRDNLHMPDGKEQQERDRKFAQVFSGGENPDKWGDPAQQRFIWGWDAEKVASEVLRERSREEVRSQL